MANWISFKFKCHVYYKFGFLMNYCGKVTDPQIVIANPGRLYRIFIYTFPLSQYIIHIGRRLLTVRTNLGKHFLFVVLYVSSIKAGTRRIICLDKLLLLCIIQVAHQMIAHPDV